MIRFALAGNPNSGKTTLFNGLTGSTAHVGNWPGVTVDKKEGVYKKCAEPISVVDLPGIYSLSPYTPEEVISRNFILDEKPDCVINIIDATNLERNLYLSTQILEIDVPMVIALNMIDEVERNGDVIDAKKLEEKIGVPVVEISALKGRGLDELMTRAYEASRTPRKGRTVLDGTSIVHLIGDCKIALEGQKVDNALFHAVKLVELDELEVKMHPDSAYMVEEFKKTFEDDTFGTDFDAIIADARYKYITKNCSPALVKKVRSADAPSRSDKIDKVLTHKFWGIPIFLLILFALFHLTFSENLLFLGAALPEGWVALEGTALEGVFGDGGINSPGVVLFNLLDLGTSSLGEAIAGAMEAGGVSEWAIGLVCDGMLGGVFAVLSFLPQILLLFLFFSILEDSGYMARVAFILDRIFRKFGLSGRAFMPMIMGFGCSVPAMVNTRTLADEKERIATIRVIPFFSCGAKLPILTAIAGGIGLTFGLPHTDLITYGMYVVGIVVAICAVLIMRSTTMKGEVPPFIMELPTYHLPQFKNLMLHLWDKAKHFIQKAFTIILASTIVIWFISHFSWGWNYLPDEQINESILAGIGKLLQPLFTPLGFGSQIGSFGWVFVVAAITGLIAKENVIATFGTLAGCITAGFVADEALEGIDAVASMIGATEIGVPALIAFIVFNMLTIPCFAAVATARAELGKKRFNMTLVFWVVTSYIVASMFYLIGEWWWTVFIFVAVWAMVITIVILNKQGKINLDVLNPKNVIAKIKTLKK
ncbi:MAG: ferrous iron transport protein B [Clostridia bacterium]|nr:ferrous iron transport protein B [Clostridia bacterium]